MLANRIEFLYLAMSITGDVDYQTADASNSAGDNAK
jgi:hypothetical protein